MRILHTCELYSPSIGGAQEVVKQLSEGLARCGHEVVVATTRLAERDHDLIAGVRVAEFAISGSAWRAYEGECERYRRFLLEGKFDVMMNYAAQQWTADLAFPLLDRLPYAKVLAPCGFSGLYDPAYAPYFERLPEAMRKYDRLIFHGENYRDVEFARKHGMTRASWIPNGASEAEFGRPDSAFRARYGIPDGAPMLLTVGSHTGLKGHALAIEAFRRARIGPAMLAIIGNTPRGAGCLADCRRRARRTRWMTLGRKRVLLLNPPRKDVVAAYHAADLFVFGSNLECSPLVLFEAMASGTPFISTACGNAEEIARWSGGGVIVPTQAGPDGLVSARAKDMAGAVKRLMDAPADRDRMAEAGRRAWRERFTWEKIVPEYERLYESVVRSS